MTVKFLIKKLLHSQHVCNTGNTFGIMQQPEKNKKIKAEYKEGVLKVQPFAQGYRQRPAEQESIS